MRVLVVTPTYNERANLGGIVGRVRTAQPDVDLLVVDDASPDRTGDVADALAAADPHVHVLHRPGKQGLGTAYLAGFDWALSQGYDAVVEMDADGSHAPEQLHRLLTRLDSPTQADLVIGARWVRGGRVHNWPLHRELLSRGANLYTRAALGTSLHDSTAGYRVYRATALTTLDLPTVRSQGYCFQVELAWRAVQAGLRVVEVPIDFSERDHGVSKMSGDIVRESFTQITTWGLRHRREQLAARLRRS